MAKVVTIDWTPAPTDAELPVIQSRLDRLAGGLAARASPPVTGGEGLLPPGTWALDLEDLVIRESFVYRPEPAPARSSDRAVPTREERPSATRLVSAHGASLRFYLSAMAVHLAASRAGAKFVNPYAIRPAPGEAGWTNFLVSDAVMRTGEASETRATIADKKVKQIHNALGTLERHRLVALAPRGQRHRHENFQLLHEAGVWHPSTDAEIYVVPDKDKERTFRMPGGFITRGWVHLLNDSEICVLLMIACARGTLVLNEGYRAIPAEQRLLHYGIGPDPYSDALRTLQWFGLVEVISVDRGSQGRSYSDEGLRLHRMKLIPSAFEDEASSVMIRDLDRQLKRRAT